jgi:RNA-directed DNA polymerase
MARILSTDRASTNPGAVQGVDGQDLEEFEADLRDNLYRIWNRMSSESYFPPPVRAVEIPKPHGGGVRMLGVPTIADRVAQTVVAMHLEQRADHRFVPDSYGYRPGKSAHDALAVCRQRGWKDDWAIDLDVQKLFDEVPWDLVGPSGGDGHRRPLGAAVRGAVARGLAHAPGRRP